MRPAYPRWLQNRSFHPAVAAYKRRGALVVGGLTLATVAASIAAAQDPSPAELHPSSTSRAASAALSPALPPHAPRGVSPSAGADRRPVFLHRTSSRAILVSEPTDGLHLTLSPGRVAIRGAHGLRVALSGPAIGRGGRLEHVRDFSAPSLKNNRVTFSSTELEEWYAGGRPGVEQGFVITNRPPGRGPLRILHTVSGNATARVEAGRQGVRFMFRAGWLRYTHLAVTGATGARVPARMSLSGRRLTITIEDSHAAYPLHVDPAVIVLADVTSSTKGEVNLSVTD